MVTFAKRSKENNTFQFFQPLANGVRWAWGGICFHLKARIIDTIMFRDETAVKMIFERDIKFPRAPYASRSKILILNVGKQHPMVFNVRSINSVIQLHAC